jgi:hypothetical protein
VRLQLVGGGLLLCLLDLSAVAQVQREEVIDHFVQVRARSVL